MFHARRRIEDPAKLRIELRNVIEELIEVNDAISEAYPPGQALTIQFDGHELHEDDSKRMAKQARALRALHEVKPQAEFPTDRKRKGRGDWCSACADAPDPTVTASARRAR